MKWQFLWISVSICSIYCLKNTEQCSPPEGWWPALPGKRAEQAKIVLFGTVVSTPQLNHTSSEDRRFYDVILRVHCIVKGPRTPEFVRVSGFSNFSGGLCVHSKAFVNKSYVILVKRKVDKPQEFQLLEVNLQKGAIHVGHKLSVLRDVMFLTGVENASLPLSVKSDSKPGCPHFKRKFREPALEKPKHKHCRCRRKKRKRKKKKRLKIATLPRNQHSSWNLKEVPTLPRTRRYNVMNFERDTVSNVVPSSGDILSLSSGSSQLTTNWLMYMLTLCCIFMWLLPP